MNASRSFLPRWDKLSDKEKRMLTLLARGYKLPQIATEMQITVHYVYYLNRLLKVRFGVETMAAVVSQAIEQGVIGPDGTPKESDS